MLSLTKLLKSFSHAFHGLKVSLKEEQNLRLEFLAALIAVSLAVYLKISNIEWIVLLLTIGLVIGSELLNTALEKVVDLASPEIHPLAKKAKDAAAASVLIFAVMALLVGLCLFLPRIVHLFDDSVHFTSIMKI